MPKAAITQAFVDRLPPADKTTWYHDTALAGFVLSVGRTSKTFYAAAEFNRSFRRIKIGRADVMQANVARRIARDDMLPSLRQGIDPRPAKPTPEEAPETFEQTWDEYRAHGTTAKSKTLVEYDRTLRTKVPHWFDRPTVTIDEAEVLKMWRRVSRGSLPSAKALMRIASAVLHDAKRRKVVDDVPTSILPRGWSTVTRRKTRIDDIRKWWVQVDKLTMYPKSALKMLLLTGLRPSEVLSLRWEHVDLDAGKVHILDPKRGPARDASIPAQTVQQLKRLERIKGSSFFVFPSHGHKGHLLSLPAGAGHSVKWSPYEARREWASVAAEIGIPNVQRGAQMGHAAGNMTDSYVVTPEVREAVQQVADEIMHRVQGAVT